MNKPNYLVVLEAIHLGITVKSPDSKPSPSMEIGIDDRETEIPCWALSKTDFKGNQEIILVPMDFSLHSFIKYCEYYSDNEISVLQAEIAFNKIKIRDRKNRQHNETQVATAA